MDIEMKKTLTSLALLAPILALSATSARADEKTDAINAWNACSEPLIMQHVPADKIVAACHAKLADMDWAGLNSQNFVTGLSVAIERFKDESSAEEHAIEMDAACDPNEGGTPVKCNAFHKRTKDLEQASASPASESFYRYLSCYKKALSCQSIAIAGKLCNAEWYAAVKLNGKASMVAASWALDTEQDDIVAATPNSSCL
jgi:hypothetical protein